MHRAHYTHAQFVSAVRQLLREAGEGAMLANGMGGHFRLNEDVLESVAAVGDGREHISDTDASAWDPTAGYFKGHGSADAIRCLVQRQWTVMPETQAEDRAIEEFNDAMSALDDDRTGQAQAIDRLGSILGNAQRAQAMADAWMMQQRRTAREINA